MSFIIAKKIAMSRRFAPDGKVVPVTVIHASSATITQVKSVSTDGYDAVQLATGRKRRAAKPQASAWGELGTFARVREFRVPASAGFERGKAIDVTSFKPGEMVRVTGMSKGRGFAGVVKRHHFRGGPASHGHKDNLRMPGSIGATFPQHVMKGTRMAGRMGGERVTVKNIEIVEVVPEQHLLLLKGAVPGPRNGWLLLQSEV